MFSSAARAGAALIGSTLVACSAERAADTSVTREDPVVQVSAGGSPATHGAAQDRPTPGSAATNSGAAPARQRTSRVDKLPYYNGPAFEPRWLSPGSAELASFHSIGPFRLVNQQGKAITQHTFANKIYVTDFFFTTCPGICLKMTQSMRQIQDAFADDDDVLLLSHSVSPDTDTPAVLAKYAHLHGVKAGKWHLVTGSQASIYALGREQYFIEEDLGVNKTDDDFLHTENFLVIDGQRHIRGIYNGLNKTEVSQLIADVRTLKHEG